MKTHMVRDSSSMDGAPEEASSTLQRESISRRQSAIVSIVGFEMHSSKRCCWVSSALAAFAEKHRRKAKHKARMRNSIHYKHIIDPLRNQVKVSLQL